MKKVPLKEYARRHRLSIYQVIKKINNGELRSETVTENGNVSQYILLDDEAKENIEAEKPKPREDWASELQRLRDEVEKLRRIVENCCAHRS